VDAPVASNARRLLVLTYHRVLESDDPLRPGEMTREAFERHTRVLSRFFNVLPLAEAWKRTLEGTLPRRAVALTFDDGYADNVELALPILARRGLAATFFIATSFLDGGRMWNDTIIETVRRAPARVDLEDLGAGKLELDGAQSRAAAATKLIRAWKHLPPPERQSRVDELARRAGVQPPTNLMMRSDQVRTLAQAGMTVGAHTVTHPILTKVDDAEAEREMRESRARLEAITGRPVTLFAYPNGRLGDDYEPRHAAIARRVGFELALATDPGMVERGSDPHRLPRFGPWPEASWRFGVRLMRFY
jgi:peptidoglycan/xylan/chitin deacetylase (PgdA/CDA1 family)